MHLARSTPIRQSYQILLSKEKKNDEGEWIYWWNYFLGPQGVAVEPCNDWTSGKIDATGFHRRDHISITPTLSSATTATPTTGLDPIYQPDALHKVCLYVLLL
jgi:hypothetical protein